MSVSVEMDPDLSALAEARAKAREARRAFEAFNGATQDDVDAIVRAMATAGTAAAEELARLAVDETGYGVYEDKIVKNKYNTIFVAASMLPMRTIGVLWVDERNRVTAVGSPMGVIAGIIPVTNPTSTVLFKCMAAVKSGNAIVCAPHPRAARCCVRAAEVMADAAVKAGAPRGLVSCLSNVTLEATGELMRHPDVALVMATGGPGMVRAAYSSGKPTLAVGAGNVPVYIHRSVKDVREAALMAITSKSFDNGTACVAEQSIVIDEPVARRGARGLRGAGRSVLLTPRAGAARRGDLHRAGRASARGGRTIREGTRPKGRRCRAGGLQGARRRAPAVGPKFPSLARSSGPSSPSTGRRTPTRDFGGAARSWSLAARGTRSASTASRMRSSPPSPRCPRAASSSIRRPCLAAWASVARPIPPSCSGPARGAVRSSPTM